MIVLDASVILKWFLREEDTPSASKFLESHILGDNQLAVPELLYYEVANALVTKVTLPEEAIISALRSLLDLDLASYSLRREEYVEAVQLAIRSGVTVCDASYVVLAEKLGVDSVTADTKLVDRLRNLKFITAL